uniref:Lipoprotein n=1 Tax=candidate division WOR-3 bacterium TaxID=2052148 RepID=A0A7C4YFE5_UNCW3
MPLILIIIFLFFTGCKTYTFYIDRTKDGVLLLDTENFNGYTGNFNERFKILSKDSTKKRYLIFIPPKELKIYKYIFWIDTVISEVPHNINFECKSSDTTYYKNIYLSNNLSDTFIEIEFNPLLCIDTTCFIKIFFDDDRDNFPDLIDSLGKFGEIFTRIDKNYEGIPIMKMISESLYLVDTEDTYLKLEIWGQP